MKLESVKQVTVHPGYYAKIRILYDVNAFIPITVHVDEKDIIRSNLIGTSYINHYDYYYHYL